MKYIIILFLVCLTFQLKSEVNLDVKNTRDSDAVFYQEVLKDTLIMTNSSNQVITVTGIGLSCGCTVVSESQFDIMSNSVKKVPFTVDLTHTKEGKSINISIMTSDKDTIQLNYNYSVKELLLIDPHFISITSPNDSAYFDLKLVNTSENEIHILNTKSNEIVGKKIDIVFPKKNIKPGENLNATIKMNELLSQNVGKLEIEYEIDNGIVLNKSIDYIIKKGK